MDTATRQGAAPVDLTRCPHCGAEDWRLASDEVVTGFAGIDRTVNDDGTVSLAWGGECEMDWNTSRTVTFGCRDCGNELPDAYKAEVVRLLYGDHTIGDRLPPDEDRAYEWALARAAQAVVDAWESGYLATAVSELDAALGPFRHGLTDEAATVGQTETEPYVGVPPDFHAAPASAELNALMGNVKTGGTA